MDTVVSFRNGTHDTFNSNKIYFVFNYLINRIQKKVSKNKSNKLKKTRQSKIQIFQISNLSVPKYFCMKFC